MRLTLRNKLLIPVVFMIVATVAAALFVVHLVVRQQVLRKVSAEVAQKIHIFDTMQKSTFALLAERARVIASAPHLKAAIETGHAETVQNVIADLSPSFKDHLLLIINHRQEQLALSGADFSPSTAIDIKRAFASDTTIGASRIGLLRVSDRYFEAALLPIVVPDPITKFYVIGYVCLGQEINEGFFAAVEKIIDCHLAFFTGDTLIERQTPLPRELETYLQKNLLDAAAGSEHTIKIIHQSSGDYLAGRSNFHPSNGAGFILIAPFESVFQEIIRPVEKTILLVGGFALLATLLIGGFISRQVVSPVRKLVQATNFVSQGRYDQPVEIRTRDEFGYLATKFEQMRESLKAKIVELGERNEELETAVRQLEKAQRELVQSEKLAATGKITAQLSHELNNPIHNIRNCLESAQRKMGNGKDPGELIALAHEETVRMGRLVRQMLDFYRPQPLEKKAVDIKHLLENVLQTLADRLANSNISLETRIEKAAPQIQGSPDQLKQVFLNLITNAIDAMPQGGTLRVETRSSEKKLDIIFADTGVGIAAEKLQNIFDPFYTTKSQASGVGLGLSVSYGIIRGHGGKIRVESEPGRGSTFTIQLQVP